jgi:hypothetical protein
LTNADASDVKANISTIMNDIWRTISFGIGRKNDDERVDHDLFDDPAWSIAACQALRVMARQQPGTVGSGNHYVDIFEDEPGRIWIGVHFGSRGLGHKTATWFLKAAGAKDGMDVEPVSCLSIRISVRSTSKGCVSAVAMHTQGVTGSADALRESSAPPSSRKFTITTTSRGGRVMVDAFRLLTARNPQTLEQFFWQNSGFFSGSAQEA